MITFIILKRIVNAYRVHSAHWHCECSIGIIISQFSIHFFQCIPSKKGSAQVGGLINPVLTRNGCIKCYISLFKEIILQQLDVFQTEIQGSLTKLCAFKTSRGHPSKW